jgi:hypothetical protein
MKLAMTSRIAKAIFNKIKQLKHRQKQRWVHQNNCLKMYFRATAIKTSLQ